MKALILAAGYGTRLYPLTKRYPKALLPVAQKPLIDYIVEKISGIKSINEVIVVTNDKFFLNFVSWSNKSKLKIRGIRLKVLNDGTRTEKSRLGAIGDIYFALRKEKIKEDTLIAGGDNLFEEGLNNFLEFAFAHKGRASIGIYDIRNKSRAGNYGVVTLDPSDSRIAGFAEKPDHPNSSLIATCLYYIPEEKLGYFKEYFNDPHSEKDSAGNFISWLSKKDRVYGFVFRKHWYDIGDPRVYKEAERVFKEIKG